MTTHDPLAAALRHALDAEPTSTGDRDLIARAIAGAVRTLGEPATDAPASSKSEPSKRAVVRSSRPPRGRTLRLVLPLAAAFAASLAMAAALATRPVSPRPSGLTLEAPEPAPRAPSAAENRPTTASSEPGISVHDLPPAHPRAAVTAESARPFPPPRLADDAVTAAQLFRDANTERHAGNIVRAVELYRELQKRHPEAAESRASRVSVGRLLLDRQGDPAGALAEFDVYLATAQGGGGTLAEEARVGRALALERLGRPEEERRAWEAFLARHPEGLYATHARERLAALGSR